MERNEIEYENLGASGQKGSEGAAQRANMVFKLIAQIDTIYDIIDDAIEYSDYLKWFLIDKDDAVVETLQKTLKEIRVQLRMRDRKITYAEDLLTSEELTDLKSPPKSNLEFLTDLALSMPTVINAPRLALALFRKEDKEIKAKPFIEQRGSIAYLAVVSHSVSRTELRDQTLVEWHEQFYAKGTAPSKTITL